VNTNTHDHRDVRPAGLRLMLRAMACNNAWANHRLLRACALLTNEEFAAPRTGFFPSLRATLKPRRVKAAGVVSRRVRKASMAHPLAIEAPEPAARRIASLMRA